MTARRYLVLGIALLAAGSIWAAARAVQRPATASQAAEASVPAAPSGKKLTLQFFRNPAPVAALTLRTLDGKPVSSSDWRGKVTIVNFWATWCGPCRAEIPDLVALQKKYAQYLQVVGVSQDEAPPDVVQRFAAERQVNYPIVMSTPELERAFPGIYALPTSYLIDREGRIVQKHVGMLNAVRTEQETRSLAGLPVDAVVEQTDPVARVALDNAAQATDIPGIDLAAIPASLRSELLQKLNGDACSCGCDLSVAKCRIDDPTCGVSLPLARKIAADLTARK
jgi:thiol-disulfide isomerase/thioredoxin